MNAHPSSHVSNDNGGVFVETHDGLVHIDGRRYSMKLS